jgi:WD40 repeat protein
MLHFRLLIAAALLQAIAALPAAAEKRVALVIGNSAYVNAGTLANPLNDANDTAQALKRFGFEVILGLDLDKPAFEKKVRDFSRTLADADTAVLFYAGHGLQVAGHNYLIPVDAALGGERDLDFEAISVDFVLRQMEVGREGKTNIVFLDACRDNPLGRNLARSMGTRGVSVGSGLAEVQTGVGTFIAYSTQPGNVALDGKGRNSPFTASFTARMQEPGRNLNAIMIDVRNDVLAATAGRQVPWDHSALTRDFYFELNLNIGVKVKEAAALPRPAPAIPYEPAIQYEDAAQHLVRTLTGHKEVVKSLAFSPDGKFALSGSSDTTMKLWDLEAAKKAKTFEMATFIAGHSVASVAFSPDGKLAWSGGQIYWSSDDTVTAKLWDVATGKEIKTFAVDMKLEEVKTLLDKKTHKETKTLAVLMERFKTVALAPDWQFALSSSCSWRKEETSGKYRTWKETKTEKYIWKETKPGKYEYDGSGGDPTHSCVGSRLALWEVATGRALRTFANDNDEINLVAFSPDGQQALSHSDDKLRLWDVSTGKEIKTFTGHQSKVNSIAFSPDGRTVLLRSDSTMKLWDVAAGNELRTIAGHMSFLASATFSPDGRYIMSGGCANNKEGDCKSGSIELWNVSTGRELQEFTGLPAPVIAVKFSPDGRFALSGHKDAGIRLWDVSEWTQVQEAKQ